ncbi:kinase-like protein [Choiromyces venosus 120613-1]|uniref:EKC/KEOPS complex subunit BUD32 n=1 Tax=Choiromyces venosus 120613-1 TaxID=1336337 RepID=A0A3N4J651_9PEZI|nr:kinase-like protein [Choiromyces venosus 120613-1]
MPNVIPSKGNTTDTPVLHAPKEPTTTRFIQPSINANPTQCPREVIMSLRGRRIDLDKENTITVKEKLKKRRKTEGWKETMDMPTPLSTPDRWGNGDSQRERDYALSGEVQNSDNLRSSPPLENHQREEGGKFAVEEDDEEPVSEDALLDSGYRILSVLGRGNFSTTYLAEDVSKDLDALDSSRLVAIKRLKRPFGAIGENEYSLLQYLHSKDQYPRHIISPISCFLAESGHFHLILERLDSGRPVSLVGCFCKEAHSKLACPARHLSLAKIVLQLLCGLLSLHSHNLIHADLTPANMLFIPSSNRIKLIDLGNTIRPEDREAYLDDFSVQSVCYRAPEILLGQGPLSRVMDVWSTGVIAVELLLDGEVVGEGLPDVELVRSHIEDREGMVRRVIELVGSVTAYRFGMYYLDAYDEASLEAVPFPPKKKRRTTAERWYVARATKTEENTPKEILRRPRKGILGPLLTEKTGEPEMVEFLMEMMEVNVHKRKTVKEFMRHPWLVEKLLGDWGGVLMNIIGGDDGQSDEDLDDDGLDEVDEEEELDEDDFDLAEETTLVNDEETQDEPENSEDASLLVNRHGELLEQSSTAVEGSVIETREDPEASSPKQTRPSTPQPEPRPQSEPRPPLQSQEDSRPRPNIASQDPLDQKTSNLTPQPIIKKEARSETPEMTAQPASPPPTDTTPIIKPERQSQEPEVLPMPQNPNTLHPVIDSPPPPIKPEPAGSDITPSPLPSPSPDSLLSSIVTSSPSPTPPIPADLISGRTSDIWHRDLAADMDEVYEDEDDDDQVMLL